MYHQSLVYLLVAFLAAGAIMPLKASESCADRLPNSSLKDFQEGPPVELDSLIAAINQCLGRLRNKDELKSMLREKWTKDIKKVEGSYNKAIKELTRSLESMHNSAEWDVFDTFDDSFFEERLEWCRGWDDNSPPPDCENGLKEDINAENADIYKFHLLYAFVREIVVEKGQIENSPQSEGSSSDATSLQGGPIESPDKLENYERDGILIALVLSIVSLFLFGLILLKTRKLRRSQNELAGTVEKLQSSQRQQTEPNLKEAEIVALIRRELIKQQPPNPRTAPATPPVVSTPSTSRGQAPAKQPSRTESAPTQKQQPKKIIAYASIPNQQGIFPMTFPRVTNKAYYQIFTYGYETHKAYFSLVDDMQRRKSAFNAPDTVMPPSACEKRYTGAIDYNPSIRITPGEIQKTNSGKWKVTKLMLVEA